MLTLKEDGFVGIETIGIFMSDGIKCKIGYGTDKERKNVTYFTVPLV